MNVFNAPIEKIKTTLVVRKRGGMDIEAMTRSIEKYGLFHPIGLTRDYELVYGWRRYQAFEMMNRETIPAVIVRNEDFQYQIMRSENDLRKDLTREEQVLLAQRIEEEVQKNKPALWRKLGLIRDELGGDDEKIEPDRKGSKESRDNKNEPTSQDWENFPNPDRKDNEDRRPDDIAAKAAGLGNRRSYLKAEAVVNQGSQPLKDAMNQNKVSIDAAYQLSKLPEKEQAAIDYDDKEAVKEKVRQIRKPPEKPDMKKPDINGVVRLISDWSEEQIVMLIEALKKRVKGKQ